uniref:RING-type domain-containing protein n=1 Tax=Echinococcus canadensis TaxID=519352 RepID=A0A915EXB5_9CEST
MARRCGSSARAGRSRNTHSPQGRAKQSEVSKVELLFEQEERTFARPNAISPHLICVICSEVFKKPYRAPCGHSYCYGCISKWLKTAKHCPVDRKPLNLSKMHHDFILESIIGDYTVACPWRSSGCSYIGPLCQLDSHKKECAMNPDHLPEALRIREKENIKSQRCTGGVSSLTNLASLTPTETAASNVEAFLEVTSGEEETDEEEDVYLPPAPPPSLLMRLFQKSDSDSRDLLCSFLAEPATGAKRPAQPRTTAGSKRSRKAF